MLSPWRAAASCPHLSMATPRANTSPIHTNLETPPVISILSYTEYFDHKIIALREQRNFCFQWRLKISHTSATLFPLIKSTLKYCEWLNNITLSLAYPGGGTAQDLLVAICLKLTLTGHFR